MDGAAAEGLSEGFPVSGFTSVAAAELVDEGEVPAETVDVSNCVEAQMAPPATRTASTRANTAQRRRPGPLFHSVFPEFSMSMPQSRMM